MVNRVFKHLPPEDNNSFDGGDCGGCSGVEDVPDGAINLINKFKHLRSNVEDYIKTCKDTNVTTNLAALLANLDAIVDRLINAPVEPNELLGLMEAYFMTKIDFAKYEFLKTKSIEKTFIFLAKG